MTAENLSEKPGEKTTKHKESFVRWQGITISQLGYAVNLFLGFATASILFAFVELKDANFVLSGCPKATFLLALAALLVSAFCGTCCVVNRLTDFRKTTRIARDRQQWERDGIATDEIDHKLEERRCEVKFLGKITWVLFYIQAVAFLVGFVLLLIVLTAQNSSKLV